MSHQYKLPQGKNERNFILIPNTNNPKEVVECINSYIDKSSCKDFSVDISFMNIIDACYVSTMCSTKYYIKYPDGNINWIVSSHLVKDFSKNMSLGNCDYFYQN